MLSRGPSTDRPAVAATCYAGACIRYCIKCWRRSAHSAFGETPQRARAIVHKPGMGSVRPLGVLLCNTATNYLLAHTLVPASFARATWKVSHV